MTKTYNGWANWETWNIALWINNDIQLYELARDTVRFLWAHCTKPNPINHCLGANLYNDFIYLADLREKTTPDLVCFSLPCLDQDSLSEMLRALLSE